MAQQSEDPDDRPDVGDSAGVGKGGVDDVVLSLRERKRIRTKQLVQAEALRLFTQRGYEQTTVDDIAHAAAMSPRTFFRYFAVKEDVALWDEYDEPAYRQAAARNLAFGDDPLSTLVTLLRRMLADVYRKGPDLLYTRVSLAYTVPEIRARFFEQQMALVGPFHEEMLHRFDRDAHGLELRVAIGAVYAAAFVAVERWLHGEGRDDLLKVFDEAIAALAGSAGHLSALVASMDSAATCAGAVPSR